MVAPTNLGSGGAESSGGGAIYLTVVGQSAIAGEINADGQTEGYDSGTGSGGSVYLQTGSLTGTGSVHASATVPDIRGNGYGSRGIGSGGRVALILTGSGADFSGFTGTIKATTGSGTGYAGAAGTIYLRTGAGAASLIVDNSGLGAASTVYTTSGDSGLNYTALASLVLTNGGDLGVRSNDTLDIGTANLGLRPREFHPLAHRHERGEHPGHLDREQPDGAIANRRTDR